MGGRGGAGGVTQVVPTVVFFIVMFLLTSNP